MRHVQLENGTRGGLVCRHDPGEQNHGDLIEFILPDNSTLLVRVRDWDTIDASIVCNNCPFVHMECPVLAVPNQERRSICSFSCVYEKVGSSMEDL
jgi:hypothetical protein